MAGGVSFVLVYPESIGLDPETNAWEISQALLRGLRLGKTVVLIVADYKLSDYSFWDPGPKGDKKLTAEAEEALADAEKDLRDTQNFYEELAWKLRTLQEEEAEGKDGANSKAKKREMKELETKAKAARQLLLAAAARLAKVEEHAKGVSQKGRIHQRAADRLLELCQLNLGCCKSFFYL